MTAAFEPTRDREARPPVTRAGTNRSSHEMSNYPNPTWPDAVALVANQTKRWVLAALQAGADDEEIAEATGLDCDQVAAIRAVMSR